MKKTTGMDRSITAKWRPATQAVRGGTWRSEHGETSEALFLTSGYTYDNAAEVAARFAGEAEGMTYSRLQNPTVAMLEERIALMEGAEGCRVQASGMAAMTAARGGELSAGDHARLLDTYRGLLMLRRRFAEITDPWLENLTVDYDEDERWIVLHRGSLRVVCNLSENEVTVPVGGTSLLAWTDPISDETGSATKIPGHSFAVLADPRA